MSTIEPICVHCNQPVTVNRDYYAVFERMHWLCFHFVFEHTGDPDAPCLDPSCPWRRIQSLEQALRARGEDPDRF
jgi:hypothetical protein